MRNHQEYEKSDLKVSPLEFDNVVNDWDCKQI